MFKHMFTHMLTHLFTNMFTHIFTQMFKYMFTHSSALNRVKVKLAKHYKLGGIMWWTLDDDDFKGA